MGVEGQVELRFSGPTVRSGNHVNLSAIRTEGGYLWLAGDETATVERLTLDSAVSPTVGNRQRSFALADLVDLPGAPHAEADLEGLARSGGWLWAIGSHTLARRRIKSHHTEAKAFRRLARVRRDPNRFVICRLAVQPGADGGPELVRVAADGRCSAVIGAPGAENLTDLLATDPHLAPSLAIPSKDNAWTWRAWPSTAIPSTSGCAARCCVAGPACWRCSRPRTTAIRPGCGSTRSATGNATASTYSTSA